MMFLKYNRDISFAIVTGYGFDSQKIGCGVYQAYISVDTWSLFPRLKLLVLNRSVPCSNGYVELYLHDLTINDTVLKNTGICLHLRLTVLILTLSRTTEDAEEILQ
jgi:hypothetical protein